MKAVMKKSDPFKVRMVDGNIEVEMKGEDIGQLYTSMFGVEDEAVFDVLLRQVIQAMPARYTKDDKGNFMIAMLQEIKPQDGLEAMLVTQMLATHSLSLEMMYRATLPKQTDEGVHVNVNRATKLQRTFVQQLEALQKKRNKGQVIQVQHVNVGPGGQAVVGNVTTGGGGK